jgi:two-component system, cell cycle sensor histidine kinase and response regulator CckA
MANVLVVDDEPVLLQLVSMILKQNGHAVLSASSGVEALMVYSSYQSRVDLVLSDVMMPGMNGIELAERFRALNPNVKILLMSGYVSGNLELPADIELVKKPFLPNQLIELVEQTLAGRREAG